MMAYRAARHESTGMTPNMLVFGREIRAPVDIVLGTPPGEEDYYNSPDEYVCGLQERLRAAHDLARNHLNEVAIRRKESYDTKVKKRSFGKGQWCYYLYPRRYAKRNIKWSRVYEGPYLIIDEIPPCDFVIQKTRRSKPLIVHADKLRECHGQTPESWLDAPVTDAETSRNTEQQKPEAKRQPRQRARHLDEDTEDVITEERLKPAAAIKRPRHLTDFVTE